MIEYEVKPLASFTSFALINDEMNKIIKTKV